MIWCIFKILIGSVLALLALGLAPMWPMLAMIGDAPGSENKALAVLGIAALVLLTMAVSGIWLVVSGVRGLL